MTEASCPSCGEPVERRQLVCLNCGGRVALRERTPWAREPVTLVAAVLLAVIVIGAGLFGFAIAELTSGDGVDPAPQQVEAPAVVFGEGQDERASTETAPAATETAPAETETAPTTEEAPPAPRADAVPGWPDGLTAHTVVLVSSSDRTAALAVAKEARASGLEAGMIRSDLYDLGSGLWIVFSGQFTTPEGAGHQASQLAERYPGAYPQLVQKSQ